MNKQMRYLIKFRNCALVIFGVLLLLISSCKKDANIDFGSLIDIEGNTYKTVKIGRQEWMAEDLKTTKYSDGTSIPYLKRNDHFQQPWDTLTTTSVVYCMSPFGAYYTSAASMNGAESSLLNPSGVQGVCPTGWHLPSLTEWYELALYLDANAEFSGYGVLSPIAGGKLKESGFSHWRYYSHNTTETNKTGFNALPNGTATYYPDDDFGNWWSSTKSESLPEKNWAIDLSFAGNGMIKREVNKSEGVSVRCIKDY